MILKILGLLMDFLGVALLIFAVMAYSELNSLATAATPSPEDATLTRIIGPEFFDASSANVKPGELADRVFKRIYFVGACSIAMIVLGPILFFTSVLRSTGHANDEKV